MERAGYAYRKSGHRFLRESALGTHEFWLRFDGRAGLVAVDAAYFVHFDALERHFKNALGRDCLWSAGGDLLNAGANPWKFWLFEERFANMSAAERAHLPSDVIHPDARIDLAVQFLSDARCDYAEPFFTRLQSYTDLMQFYHEYLESGFTGRLRPQPDNVICLSLILAAMAGHPREEILDSAKVLGPRVDASVHALLKYVDSHDLR
jgi:hypothetical protein